MPKTYAQVQREIDQLKAQAEQLKRKEVGEVVARIKEAIGHYGLTPVDLFGGTGRKGGASGGRVKAKSSRNPRYTDGKGNVWGGRGPRPKWLREALASGKQLADFETKTMAGGNGSPSTRKVASKRKQRSGAIRYRDDAGNSWTGVGRKPRWFQEALAAGKMPEDLAAG
jgi:DNA-binding protein H-NS